MISIQMLSVHKFHALNCTNLLCNMYILSTDADQTVKRETTGGGIGKLSAHTHTHTFSKDRTQIQCSAHSKILSGRVALKEQSDILGHFLICSFNSSQMESLVSMFCDFSTEIWKHKEDKNYLAFMLHLLGEQINPFKYTPHCIRCNDPSIYIDISI